LTVAEMTIAARDLDELRRSRRPLDDDELARRLGVSRPQAINQACRKPERAGHLRRYVGSAGKIVNPGPPDPAGRGSMDIRVYATWL
jgi:hypothetical protein